MRADVHSHTVRVQGLRLMRSMMIAGLLLVAARAHAAPDPREMTAREAYAAGRYEDALDIFVKLYAEKLHPNYLRNIGRCYQNLGQPDRAISSFREYLRKAKKLRETERAEIEGYITEMEQLKRTQESERGTAPGAGERPLKSAPPAATLPTAPAAPATPAPAAAPSTNVVIVEREPLAPQSPPPAVDLKARPVAPAATDEPSSPVYTRWWFWVIVGGVVAAGVGGAALAGLFTKKEDAVCTGMCK